MSFADELKKQYKKKLSEIQKPNVLVLGGTGCGKSTLVNLVFNREVAKAGAGKPQTRGFIPYSTDYVNIYDSEGYETGQRNQDRYKSMVRHFLEEHSHSVKDSIHLAWLCVSEPAARVTDADVCCARLLREQGVPFAVVLTQADAVDEAQFEKLAEILRIELGDVPLFETSSDPTLVLQPGLNELHQWSLDRLRDSLFEAFLSLSRRDLAKKHEHGRSIVAKAAAIVGSRTMIPLPLAAAPLLMITEAVMVASLCSLWGIEISDLGIGGPAGLAACRAEEKFAAELFKCIPGAGLASAALASSICAGLGHAINSACMDMVKDELDGGRQDMASYFGEKFNRIYEEESKKFLFSKT